MAERENQAVVVMWFIDNHPQASAHKVLPWFHSKAELATPKAAPRTKLSSATDFYIKTVSEWEKFRRDVESGKRIQRVIVEPEDAELIRNQQFARELGALAASNNIVVELSGGILSHAYYVLQRSGASVECIDLYGEDEDVAEYNKLVRDKIPALIEARGERVETVELKGDALVAALQRKLVEEAFEARDAKSGPELIGEMADILEVARSLCGALNVSTSEVEAEREDKRRSRGGFDKGLMLKKTATPHSIPKEPAIYLEPPALNLKADRAPEPIISEIADLPSKPLYRRPDLRQIERQLEKLFTFETDTTLMGDRAGNVDQTLNFSMPMGQGIRGNFALTVELRRTGSSIRGVVRLRPGPLQLEFQFGDAPLERES
ncbi:MAG: nucleoside triphosphate pyrophosphohydrolase [Acidobacteriota bacterium]